MRVAREKRLHPRVAFCAFCLMEWGVINKGSEDGKGVSEGSANEARDARRAASGLEGPAGGMPDGTSTGAASKGAAATYDRRGSARRKAREEAKGGDERGTSGKSDGERGTLPPIRQASVRPTRRRADSRGREGEEEKGRRHPRRERPGAAKSRDRAEDEQKGRADGGGRG